MSDSNSTAPKRRRYMTRWYVRNKRRQEALAKQAEGRVENITDEEFCSKEDTLQDSKSKYAETLKVQSVNFHFKSNRQMHHTDEFEQEDLIVRRGAPFFLSFTFQREVQLDRDLILLQLVTGNRPKQSKSTINRLPLLEPQGAKTNQFRRQMWKARCVEVNGNTIKIEVTPAANVFIGIYEAYLETKNVHDPEDTPERYQLQEDFIVIFNPWCQYDIVHMENDMEREEYVMNESGMIWVGSANFNRARPWNFGQFDDPCLDAALMLLKMADLPENGYKNPVSVIRSLSAIINSCDDDGLLEGRWTANFPKDCTTPSAWTGSVAILKEFMESKKSVRFGQCWVFSGLMTTLLRALGIPTRSVTNFESAHDTDSSMTIDFHFDEDGEPLSHLNDSVWNFHVWNESWLKRPDLPSGYDGWQAHDATPQECSEGVMRCGPAPLKAIKEGHVYLLYDIPFIFAEVNGDRVYWTVSKTTQDTNLVDITKSDIGRYISTKAVGSDERQDITHMYKYPEGSLDERRVVRFVNQFSSRAEDNIYDMDILKDVEFKFMPPKTARVGEPFELKIRMRSKSEAVRNIAVNVSLMSSYYTGITRQKIKAKHQMIELLPSGELEFQLPVDLSEYETHLGADGSFSCFMNCKVIGTKQTFLKVEKFTLEMPELLIMCPSEIAKNTENKMKIEFINPLNLNLTNVVFHVEGARILPPMILREQYIPPRGKVVKEITLLPKVRGYKRIISSLASDQLKGIEGVGKLRVV